ncbi:hypothetical protein SARC_10746 [Sphaeroforma arctica JP610]|uniref:LNR domain-containing protein n=1 Tax=Sphaeroforma arctica JP610 TaxID=667725 RepID=A0A0L0FJW4_9EUKA|nr:hypothetical protein SARC_10746 [Sphaeroforma arctica JP610]KNC76771.1 hypothetical protein SARC_10746 [Sphaeroforma arctica JP610]|eukprot:XP_014150673.1 hypothetical protein SARC_10746 [Sphaeroforma arctica JP610]
MFRIGLTFLFAVSVFGITVAEPGLIARREYDACEWYDYNGCCPETHCKKNWLNDGECDAGCMSPFCDYDSGDCDHMSEAQLVALMTKSAGQLVCSYISNKVVTTILSFVTGGAYLTLTGICKAAEATVFSTNRDRRSTIDSVHPERLLEQLKLGIEQANCYESSQSTPACVSRQIASYVHDKMNIIQPAFLNNRTFFNDAVFQLQQQSMDASIYDPFLNCIDENSMRECIDTGLAAIINSE